MEQTLTAVPQHTFDSWGRTTRRGCKADTSGLGYIPGATYLCDYWGFTFKVLGYSDTGEVWVRMIDAGHKSSGKHEVGDEWKHRTALSPKDKRLS